MPTGSRVSLWGFAPSVSQYFNIFCVCLLDQVALDVIWAECGKSSKTSLRPTEIKGNVLQNEYTVTKRHVPQLLLSSCQKLISINNYFWSLIRIYLEKTVPIYLNVLFNCKLPSRNSYLQYTGWIRIIKTSVAIVEMFFRHANPYIPYAHCKQNVLPLSNWLISQCCWGTSKT